MRLRREGMRLRREGMRLRREGMRLRRERLGVNPFGMKLLAVFSSPIPSA
jgi:hypothetical protein